VRPDGGVLAALARARLVVDSAYHRLQNAEALVSHIEGSLKVEKRWDEDSPEYKKYKAEVGLQEYRTALDELERLVVMRLFELSKLGLSGTGMFHIRVVQLLNIWFQAINFAPTLPKR
jgi:hypothetical protein